MRTPFVTLALLTVALSGCAITPRVENAEPAAPPALRVWIGFPIGGSRVHPIFTNREAHVAMFEIIPGRGATMVYPRSGAQAFASDAHYADLAVQPGRVFYHTDPFGQAAFQPRYYYAIASAAPLNLSRLQTSLGAVRRVLGRMYSSYRPFDVIDRVTEIVVPMQSDEDWATDLFVDWPTPPMPIFAAYHLVRCANGRVIQVPSSYPYYGCPGDAALAVAAVEAQAKPPKEMVRAPRAPRGGGDRGGVELSSPGAGSRRRAETSARRPRPAGMSRSPSEGIRYSGDRVSTSSPGPSPRAPASSSTGGAERSRAVERSEPASKSAPSGESSGKEKKP
jgi:hypothetical protein